MAVKTRSLLNEIQIFNILVSMVIIVVIAAVALAIISFNMLQDLRQRSVDTADELETFLKYPLYAVDDAQAVRIAQSFLASDKIAGITLQSTAQGLLLKESQERGSAWIPPVTRDIRWKTLPLGQFTITFSDRKIRATLFQFGALALVVIAAVLVANIGVNRYFIAHRVKRPFDSLVAAMQHIAEGNYKTLIAPTKYRDVNIIVDQFNEMAGRIHQKNEEQKATEDALRKSEERYRNILETTAEWIWEMDLSGRHLYANPGVTAILGYRSEEMIGQRTADFLHPEDRQTSERLLPQLIAEKRGWREWILRWRHKDGSYRYLESNSNPILSPAGELLGYLGADRDITARKQAQEESERLQQQLLQLQKMEAVGTLAGGIAHDFNNILVGILGYVELAVDHASEEDQLMHDYLARILEAGNRARNLVQQILNFSRQGRSTQVVLALTPLIKECTKLLESVLPRTITINLDLSADEDTVLADPTQIHQVVMNLGTNAFQAMRIEGGRMTFKLENIIATHPRGQLGGTIEPGAYVKLSVIDTGPGIPEHLQDRIFDPYFTTKPINEGTGLGLSVTQGIVTSHRGLIEIEATSTDGTTFAVYFPITEKRQAKSTIDPWLMATGNNENIMVVDDESFSLDVLTEILTLQGYRVSAYQSSREALERLEADPKAFDLLLTDQTMPELTGVQLAAEVRKRHPRMPIILCTGYSETITAETATNYGIARFLMKPVPRQELVQAVHEVLHPGEETP